MKHLVLIIAICATTVGRAQESKEFNYGTYAKEIFEQLRMINEARAEAGVPPLEMDSVLFKAARHRCEEIAQKFSHTRPNGKRFDTIIRKSTAEKYDSYIGENIAMNYNSAAASFDAFMESRGHRTNILNVNYTKVGICYHPFKGRWVQLFGSEPR